MQPVKYDADGRIITDATGAIVSYANGLPFTADGALAVSTADPIAFASGIPTDESGKVTVTE